jgi:peptidoglycan hydrolase CwlO-like protein
MRKRVVSYALLFTLVISFASIGLTYGNNERDQLNNVQQEKNKVEKELADGKKAEQNLINQIKSLESQMLDTQREIDELRGNIDLTQARINEALAELNALEAALHEQNENLNARLRAMYMNGNIKVLDVLLGSGSISDFMTNMDRIRLIYELDREVLESLEAQHQVIETQKQYLDNLRAELIAEREKEANKKETLKENQNQVAVKKTEVSENNKLLSEYIDLLNEEAYVSLVQRLFCVVMPKLIAH